MRSVWIVAGELMMATRLEGLLRAVGCPVVVIDPEVPAIQSAAVATHPAVVILDLLAPPSVVSAVLATPGVAVIAFGPHTDRARLAAARSAGAAEVLPRSALTHGLVPLVAKHLSRASPDMPGSPPA